MEQRGEVHIIGAGFSGLSLAYLLLKKGIQVQVFEKSERAGGLISTTRDSYGIVEAAANGFLTNSSIEELLAELKVDVLSTKAESKKRYIYYKEGLSRWPLNFIETLCFVIGILKVLFLKAFIRPKKDELLSNWTSRVFGKAFTYNLLAPGLYGVYAADIDKMSAKLLTSPLFSKKKKKSRKGYYRGTITARGGMGEVIDRLSSGIEALGGKIHYESNFKKEAFDNPKNQYVIATSVTSAKSLLAEFNVPLLSQITELPLVCVSVFFKEKAPVEGFGALFPKDSSVSALGVLLSSNIFEGRSNSGHSERWIFGGEKSNLCHLTDDEIILEIKRNREIVFDNVDEIEKFYIHRYPYALPQYDLDLERFLFQDGWNLPSNIHLTGNYLGGIGLSKIYDYNIELSCRVEREVRKYEE